MSQGLFALTGPITKEEIEKASMKTVTVKSTQKLENQTDGVGLGIGENLGRMIQEKVKAAIEKKTSREVSDELKMVGDLDISKIIDDAMKGKKSPELEKLKKLDTLSEKKKKDRSSKSSAGDSDENR